MRVGEILQKTSVIEPSTRDTARGRRAARVAVIGGGLGGLSAAIHLKLAGLDVTVYEKNERAGGRANIIERAGYRFDTGPSLLNYPWVFEELFSAAGRRFEDYVRLLAVEPSVGFQWPDGASLQLSSDIGRLLEEFERVEPGVGPRLLAYFRDAAEKYRISFEKLVTRNEDSFLKWIGRLGPGEMARLSIHRSLASELGRFFKSDHIREALGSYGMYLGGSPYQLPGLFSILPYGELAFGLWLPKGGIFALVMAVERLAREIGVRIETSRGVRKIITRAGQVAGLELEDGRIDDARIVVSNVDVPTTDSELISDARLSARARRTRMTPGVMTFYFGLRGKVEKIGHHTIFLPGDYRGAFDCLLKKKRIPEEMPFYVSVPSATDPELAPAGCDAVFVLVPTPLISEMPSADFERERARVRERIFARLRDHGVEITPERIEVEEVLSPVEWRNRFGLYDGSAFGAAHTLFQMGPMRARNHSAEIEGLFYAGAGTTPGTGMPMVVLSGKMVAERVVEFVSRSGLPARS
jgi:phytoene desaturase